MRTKALLLGAAIGAVSLATSMAQVYSVNIVGYVNTTIPQGWSIISNPLNATGGNTIANVMPKPPNNMTIYKYINGAYVQTLYYIPEEYPETAAWQNPAFSVNPGEGIFVNNGGPGFTWTFVGEVPTGNNMPVTVNKGFNLLASIVPKTGKLATDLGYSPSMTSDPEVGVGDNIYKYVNSSATYNMFQWYSVYGTGAWSGGNEPTIEVGTGFWLLRGGEATTWTQTFNVGQ